MKFKPRKFGLIVIVSVAALAVIGGEAGVRLSGLVDFPVYQNPPDMGYILAPNQRGTFLNRNAWVFNDKSQGAEKWQPNGDRDLLLLGDSIVLGGNPLDQKDRLGPQLEDDLDGWKVWPASAGSWSVINEIHYLHRFPEVADETDQLVWVLNTGDFAAGSVWKLESTHPRHHPLSALWYVVDKYVVQPRRPQPPALPDAVDKKAAAEFRAELERWHAKFPDRKVTIVLYPNRLEMSDNPGALIQYRNFKSALQSVLPGWVSFVEVKTDPRWRTSFYRDSIHPTAEGDRVLAEILAGHLL